MSVAIRTITRLQDADDAPALGAGQDGYALTWDNASGAFVATALSAGVTDHGALTGLTPDDDHTQYALLAGRSGGQTLYGGTDANDDITIHGTSNATRTTSYVLLQPTAGNVGIGTSAPVNALDVNGYVGVTRLVNYGGVADILRLDSTTVRLYAQDGGCAITSAATGGPLVSVPLAGGMTAWKENATTNVVENILSLNYRTSGTAAAGFGSGLYFGLESSTTQDQNAARIQALWYEATHATRKADLVLTAYDTAEREGLRIRGAGSEPAIGFYGVAPIARALLATGVGATVDNVITALQNLGLVKQS